SWALKFGITKIPLMVKPIEDVEVGEQVENKADFITAVKREKQQFVDDELGVHVGTFPKENADPVCTAKSAIEKEGKPSQNPIFEEQMDEVKSVFTTVEEGSIIDTFLLSFEGADLIDEAIME
ncbi:hypothetical protein KI387_003013, partial [Taxus chinensis]